MLCLRCGYLGLIKRYCRNKLASRHLHGNPPIKNGGITAGKILSHNIKPHWIIEVLPCGPRGEANAKFETVFELMASHGYAARGIDEAAHQLVPFTPDKAREVQAGAMKTDMSNFLFTARDDDLVQRLA